MLDTDPITEWIARLRNGDDRAAEGVYWAYFKKLMELAWSKLGDLPRRAEDEEDAAQSALKSYFRGVAAGRFDGVRDRYDLWHLLAKITARKVVVRQRRFYAQKRPRPLDEAGLAARGDASGINGLDQVIDHDRNPEAVVEFTDELRFRLQQLPDDEFRQLALLKLEGYTNSEIAERLGTYQRKIERRLEITRAIWSGEGSDDAGLSP